MKLPQIRLENVTVRYDDRDVLTNLTLSLDEQRIGIIGANGAGKSTLSRLLNGLVLPTSGTVRVGELTTAKHSKQIRRDVGFVFQNPANQIIMPLVAEDIAFGLKNLGLGKQERQFRVAETLSQLNIMHLAERESHTLSGGEQQMVALAAVIAMQPRTIVFDEPTTMLDLKNRLAFQREIARLDQRAIVVTHDLEILEDFDRVLVVTDGGIRFDGAPDQAIAHYRQWSHA
ncbi:energy-coupling factor ABC transporter ATP-binding protein [Glutamicibacter protophormiae]|uniref:Biotin transport system ATP-binding protein n=1 Tax=Glutamicibacter protophormiae TaxID=37930 RepID=A0ABS4XTU2_GLUPR|nr:ABC transporter ATP-binding protein [Glutamicibacter protophormiae]MBP2399910.1 biotin transport system ATP-binding protein [Glutamicibacter protophormiae]GGL76763.1 ABC transporter ATP-binding protein [Glutamicibacter protophormiae]